MGWLTAAELVTKTRYSEAVQQQVAAALDAPAGADRDAACLAALTEAEKELRCDGKRPSEANMLKRLGGVKKRLKKAAVKLAAGRWRRISAALRRGMATLKLGHAVLGMRRAQFAKDEAPRIAAVWLRAAAAQVADSRRRRAKKAEIEAARAAAPVGQRTRHVEPLPPTFAVKVPIRGLVKGVWRDGTATVVTASFAYDRDDGERKEAPLLNAEEMMPIVVDEPPDGANDDDDDVEEESVPVRVRATEASFEVVDVRPAAAADAFKRMAAKLRASRPKPATVLEDAGLEAPPYIALRSRGSPKTPSLFRSDEDLSFSASECVFLVRFDREYSADTLQTCLRRPTFRTNCTGNVCSVQHKEDVKLVRSGVLLRDCNIGIPGVAALLDLPAAAATVLEEELKPTEAGKILADMLPPKVLPCVVGHLIEKGAIPKTCAVTAFGGSVGGGTAQVPGQDKSAKFPTSKAPISAVFHSFRLIFGRAIISRNGLEAWMFVPERARAEHSR